MNMKTKTLLFSFVLIANTLFATTPTLLVSEDFSSDAWQAEFLLQNPGDANVDPVVPAYTLSASNFGLSSNQYFGKYYFNGAVMTDGMAGGVPSVRTCADSIANPVNGIVHKESVTGLPVAFRFRSGSATTNFGTYMEFPELTSAGLITLHARSGNSTLSTTLQLQQYDAGTSAWTTIHTFELRPYGEVIISSIDEIVTYDISSASAIKLRIIGGQRFAYLYRVDVAAYGASGLNSVKVSSFKLAGRTLTTYQPVVLCLYNSIGAKVFEKSVHYDVVLPASLGKGVFFVKSELGSQKIFLN